MKQSHDLAQVLSITFEVCESAIKAINDGDPEKAKRLLEKQVMENLAFQTLRHTNADIGSPFMNKLIKWIYQPTEKDEW